MNKTMLFSGVVTTALFGFIFLGSPETARMFFTSSIVLLWIGLAVK
jgi:hypothetical protein